MESALRDGSNDTAIDAIIVDPDAREITVFQAKRRSTEETTQADADLPCFRGIAPHFRDPEGIDDLVAAAPMRN